MFKRRMSGVSRLVSDVRVESRGNRRRRAPQLDALEGRLMLTGGGIPMESLSLNYTKIEYRTIETRQAADLTAPPKEARASDYLLVLDGIKGESSDVHRI